VSKSAVSSSALSEPAAAAAVAVPVVVVPRARQRPSPETKTTKTPRPTALITVAWALTLAGALINQGTTRLRLRIAAKRAKRKAPEGYGPSAPPALHAASRVSANTLEWGAVFLPLLWVAAMATEGANPGVNKAGWIYVGARVLYAVLAVGAGGVSARGPEPAILAATGPAYACLGYLAVVAVRALVL
jgi:uncharacterized MAPEG superfamily protein